MKNKRGIAISILSLGVIFIALLFSAPSKTETQRYFEETVAIVAESFPEESNEVLSDVKPADATPIITETSDSGGEWYDVTRVVDGDTVKIMRNGKEETLRLIGMNTPETVDPRTTVECFGKEASNKAKELLSGKRVRLEFDAGEGTLDKYQRTLAYLYMENGDMFNEWMIKNGYAYEYTYDDVYKYQTEFKSAEKYARENQLGLWSPETCSGEL